MLINSDDSFLSQFLPALTSMKQQGGVATAYVCQDFTCSLPITDPEELRRILLEGITDTQREWLLKDFTGGKIRLFSN